MVTNFRQNLLQHQQSNLITLLLFLFYEHHDRSITGAWSHLGVTFRNGINGISYSLGAISPLFGLENRGLARYGVQGTLACWDLCIRSKTLHN